MLRIITYAGGGTTLTMPVTPESYKVTTEQSVDTINVHTAGDITITGTPRAAQWTETYLLPSKAYSFLSENSQAKPQVYIDTFLKWQKAGTAVQYIVSSEPQINIKCLIQTVEYGESGGFGNYTLTVTLRAYRGAGALKQRLQDVTKVVRHKVKKGETLGSIAKYYYGDETLKKKLMAYNKLKSAAAVKKDKIIKVPPRKKLKK